MHGVDGVTVQINKPPTSGPYMTRTDAVEAIVQRSYTPTLAKFISSNLVNIRARSVSVPTTGACVLALHPTSAGAITLQGSANVSLNGCDARANSSNASAVDASGSSRITLATAKAKGGIVGADHIIATDGIVTGVEPYPDPYATRSYGTFNKASAVNFPNSGTISPGVYKGAIQGAITMSPGVYFVDGGSFNLNGGASIYGRGVTIVLTNITGPPTNNLINGNSSIDLTPPTPPAGTAGIVLFGDRSMAPTTFTINGGSAQSWGGAIYLPTTDLTFIGGASGNTGCLQMVTSKIRFSGVANMSMNCAGRGTEIISPQKAVLIE